VGAGGALFVAVFLACTLEAVEATTIVLAAGTARDWRSAGLGVGAALGVLSLIVAALGPAVSQIPLRGLRVVVGALLLVFGVQWLRKAILRASGHKAVHDEDKLYAEHLARASAQPPRRSGLAPDWYGFTLSFKGVLLEGLEVVFIVLTFGSNARDIALAAIAAGCASVDSVGQATEAGTNCGSCRAEIKKIIDANCPATANGSLCIEAEQASILPSPALAL